MEGEIRYFKIELKNGKVDAKNPIVKRYFN
jgi:hypothetical protein